MGLTITFPISGIVKITIQLKVIKWYNITKSYVQCNLNLIYRDICQGTYQNNLCQYNKLKFRLNFPLLIFSKKNKNKNFPLLNPLIEKQNLSSFLLKGKKRLWPPMIECCNKEKTIWEEKQFVKREWEAYITSSDLFQRVLMLDIMVSKQCFGPTNPCHYKFHLIDPSHIPSYIDIIMQN